MNYLYSITSSISQSRPFQWSLNKARGVAYPFYYNHNAWEANLIVQDSNIWLGSLASACDREALRARNITRIITAVYDLNPIFPDDSDLIYLKIPVLDSPTEEIIAHFNKAVDFIEESVQNGRGVLVHCVYGVSRSATLMCAYLIKKKGFSVKQAIADVKRQRPEANPNCGFLLQLGKFEKTKSSYFDGSPLSSTSPFFTLCSDYTFSESYAKTYKEAPTLLLGHSPRDYVLEQDDSILLSETVGPGSHSGFSILPQSKRTPKFTIDDE